MQAGCQQNSRLESTTLQKADKTDGFNLGNRAAKLHAIQALDCWPFMI
jgi:hypothetical protein